jgi:hypothetical protein
MKNNKEVSFGVGYFAGVSFVCMMKGFWYGMGIILAMKVIGVEL